MKNECAKRRPVDSPYEIWVAEGDGGTIEYRVLKKYHADDLNPRARWFVAARSKYTHGRWEYGDMMARDVMVGCRKIYPGGEGNESV